MSEFRSILLLVLCGLLGQSAGRCEQPAVQVQLPVELTTIEGEALSLADAPWRVVCMLGTECPVSRFYAARLESLAQEFAKDNVQFIGVHCNSHDSEADIRTFAKELGVTFPQVRDGDQSLARQLSVKRIPEVFLVDASGKVRYRGRVDDQYSPGVKRAAATNNYLKTAIKNVLAGKVLVEPQTEPVGCLITFEKPTPAKSESDVTYCKTIAPLFNAHCVECHRPGEIGPFDISNYDELRGWAEMIVEVVEQKRMPPWHADPNFGAFKNERHLPEEALGALKEWVNAGMPYGDKNDLPAQPEFVDGWRLAREPELVVAMRETPYTVPASGTVDYQYFVVDPQIHEDCWISSAQIVPGNPAVVHHAIVFVRPPDGVDFEGIGWLTAYVPGQRATIFPAGCARKIPAGSKFVFQMHYTPNGQEQTDRSQVGLTFVDRSEVTHEVFTMVGIDQEFEIAPGDANCQVTSKVSRLPRDGRLLAVAPHMHLRGKSFDMRAVAKANGSTSQAPAVCQNLLKVPQYDFNWQHTYEFAEPLELQGIDSFELTTTFDNSEGNPFNPDPREYVVWGEQTWEEMAVTFLEVAKPITPKDTAVSAAPTSLTPPLASNSDSKNEPDEPTAKQIAFADQFLQKFDTDKDGKVLFADTPRIVQNNAFRSIDRDADGIVTRDELIEAARTQSAK